MDVIKFYEKGQDNPQNLIVQWNLGNVCNYSCEYCPSYLHNGQIQWPELDIIKNTLLKIKNRFPNKTLRIELLGGEVTLKKDFIEVMSFIKEQQCRSLILTNGSRTLDYWKKLATNLDEVILTFHPQFADKDHYNSIIDICLENKVNPIVHIAMVKDLFWDLTEYQKYLKNRYPDLRIDMLLMMDKEGRHNNKGFFYNYEEEQLEYLRNNETGSTSYVAEYSNGERVEYGLNQVRTLGINNFQGFLCGSTTSLIVINFLGVASTSLCRSRPSINVFTGDIDSLFEPTVCPLTLCQNPSDIRTLKIKN